MHGGVGIDVVDIDTPDMAAWDAYVVAHPEGTFSHLSGWKSVIGRALGHRVYLLAAKQGNEIVGVLPLAHVKSLLFGNSLISTGFCVYGGPLASSDDTYGALDRAAIALADRLDAGHIEYRLRRPLNADWHRKDDVYATFRKKVSEDPEENLKAIPRKQRAMVRKGVRAGLKSEVTDDPDAVHAVYAASVRNLGTPVFPRRLFRELAAVFGDACQMLLIRHEGEVVAGVLSYFFRDEVLPYFGGSTPIARKVAANDFMYYEVMRRAGERGCRLFDFGRSKVGTGSYNFKRYWGFEPEPLPYEYFLRKGDKVPDLNPLNPKFRYAIAAWKRLPLWITNRVGPMIARNLG